MSPVEIMYLIFLGLCLIFIIKSAVTCHHHCRISDAICRYCISMIDQNRFNYEVYYDDMEEFDTTLWRLWDWGYKRILPSDKFEIIKPYMKKEK